MTRITCLTLSLITYLCAITYALICVVLSPEDFVVIAYVLVPTTIAGGTAGLIGGVYIIVKDL